MVYIRLVRLGSLCGYLFFYETNEDEKTSGGGCDCDNMCAIGITKNKHQILHNNEHMVQYYSGSNH